MKVDRGENRLALNFSAQESEAGGGIHPVRESTVGQENGELVLK